MVAPEFVTGQRWVSNTESELGLGVVVEHAGRRVVVGFPAAGAQRTYATDNAPLSRVQYDVGERISSTDGRTIEVTERRERDGRITYVGLDGAGNSASIEETELDSSVHFSTPGERLFAGQIDKNSSFELRAETLSHLHRQRHSPFFGLLGPRVELLPHQLYIAHEVSRRHAPRVLLADEVGLGKTIEAGLILHQQLLDGVAQRVMIAVPDSLLHQWLVEMLRRFNLKFTIVDDEACAAAADGDDGNPFESAQLILCTLSFLVDNPERRAQASTVAWDLLVVDEAHHLGWSETGASAAYACVEDLARAAGGLLLLTATPEQHGIDGHFARLRLLDPARYHDLGAFRDEEAGYRPVAELVQQLLAVDAAERLRRDAGVLEQLAGYLGEDIARELRARLHGNDLGESIEHAVARLLDRHGTGRVLFRNTRDAVAGFPPRQLHGYPLEAPAAYHEHAPHAAPAALLRPEMLLGDGWVRSDPRVGWLATWLAGRPHEKVLVLCARADTAQTLEDYLRLRRGIRSAAFHEGLTLVARDRAAAYFADDEERAQALICSEIGSEGRNFQFAQHLVLFDLPLDPELLEQRIGRLDRIGQTQVVHIHVPYYEHTAQAVLLRWYHEGINAFERACAAAQTLSEAFGEPLLHCLRHSSDTAALETLLSDTSAATASVLQAFERGRDRLLELNSCDKRRAAGIVESVAGLAHRPALSQYLERVFDQFGVEAQDNGRHGVVLHPGDHMLCHSFPELPEDGLTATYDRAEALAREDLHFLTWEHPMVRGAMDMILAGEFGNTAVCTLRVARLPPGTLLLEAIFVVFCAGAPSLELQRYLPHATLRVLVDVQGRDLGAALDHERMSAAAQPVPEVTARELVRRAREPLRALIERAWQHAARQQQAIAAAALEQLERTQGAELERLRALAVVNPNIRAAEVDFLAQTVATQRGHLQNAQLKLDAIRVALST